jgi:hypothetical protein
LGFPALYHKCTALIRILGPRPCVGSAYALFGRSGAVQVLSSLLCGGPCGAGGSLKIKKLKAHSCTHKCSHLSIIILCMSYVQPPSLGFSANSTCLTLASPGIYQNVQHYFCTISSSTRTCFSIQNAIARLDPRVRLLPNHRMRRGDCD